MNKKQSSYRKRWIGKRVREALKIARIVVISGARQTGKSSFVLNEKPFNNWRYLTLDKLDILSQAERDPSLLISGEDNLVIDEIQKSPYLLSEIKYQSDKNPERKFILTGSANLLLMKKVSETLAGRVLYFDLRPFAISEWHRKNPSNLFTRIFNGEFPKHIKIHSFELESYLFKGLLPPLLKIRSKADATQWWEGYTKTYLERDLRDISEISRLADFKSLMEMLALRTGSILNESGIAREINLSQPSAHRYINLLETSNLFIRLQPYLKNKKKRLTKSPKAYFLDPGLTTYLAGYRTPSEIPDTFKGFLFETLILSHLFIYSALNKFNIFYWRTRGGREKEVDFVLEEKGKTIGIEVKYKNNINYNDIQNLADFISLSKKTTMGIIVYTGKEVIQFSKNIFALPCYAIL